VSAADRDAPAVKRHVEILAGPNPPIGHPSIETWAILTSKRDSTAELMAMGYSRESIDSMVGAVSDARMAEWRASVAKVTP
jgi:hypothetical protein